jgi:hypothetical protein
MEHLPRYEFPECVNAVSRRLPAEEFHLLALVSCKGFRPVHLSREPSRSRGLSAVTVGGKLYHMGFRGKVARSTLAEANESRDWRSSRIAPKS